MSMKSVSSFNLQIDVVMLSSRGTIVTPPGASEAKCGIFPAQMAQSSWAFSLA